MTNKRMVAMLATFLAVATVASPLLSMLQGVIGLNPEVLRLPTLATAVGAAAVWSIWRESFRFPQVTGRSAMRAAVLAVLFAAATIAILIALNLAEGSPWSPLEASTLPTSLGLILTLQMVGAVGEEVGWRGVVC